MVILPYCKVKLQSEWGRKHKQKSPPKDPKMSDALRAAVEDAEHVVKKQKTCAKTAIHGLDTLLLTVQDAINLLKYRNEDPNQGFLQELCNSIDEEIGKTKIRQNITKNTKELHSAVSKLGKVGGGCLTGLLQSSTTHSTTSSPTEH